MNKASRAELSARPKISVIGYSGSGKSTLAGFLGERLSVPVLYLDTVQFLPGWEVRSGEEKLAIVRDFLDTNDKNGWVIDGNYTKLEQERKLNESDLIVFLSFNRISCFLRAYKRSRRFKNKSRPSMTEGCNEKFDLEFIKWILLDGRNKERRERFKGIIEKFPEKSVVIKNQKQLDRFMQSI